MCNSQFEAYRHAEKLDRPLLEAAGGREAFDSLAVDCPFVFEHDGKIWMLYVGFDGVGYQCAFAWAESPVGPFTRAQMVLRRGEGSGWDTRNAGANWILCDNDLWGVRRLKKHDGKYWMTYHSYPGDGYESGPGTIGLAYCEDESLVNWTRVEAPILRPEDGAEWERGGLYKSCLLEHEGIFYLFYNAKNDPPEGEMWHEQTGLATSADFVNWTRHPQSPMMPVGVPGSWDSLFTSEPCVFYDSRAGRWVMFYFGFDGLHAQEGAAVSSDLLAWTKSPSPIIAVGGEGALDEWHAHKPSVLYHGGRLHHYFCACRPIREGDPAFGVYGEQRCITAAWRAV